MIINFVRSLSRRFYVAYCRFVIFRKCKGYRDLIIGPDVCSKFRLIAPANIVFGKGTVLNGDCYINGTGGVVFGKFCHVGKGLTVYSVNHNYMSTSKIPYDEYDIKKPVVVNDCVWIGANVCILPGSVIGRGAILSMGSVIRGEVQPGSIMAGNPAKKVGMRDMNIFTKLYINQSFC